MIKVKRVKRSEATWRELFSRQAASGMAVSEFCRHERINAGLFRRWRAALDGPRGRGRMRPQARRPKMSRPPAMPAAAPFIDLGALGGGGGRCEVRLDFGGGLVLSVVRG